MSIQSVAYSSGGIVGAFTAWGVFADSAPGISAAASLTFAADGSISYAATAGDLSSPGSTQWYNPITSAIGANYYIRFTATSGTFTTNDASTFTILSSSRTVTKSATTGAASVTFTIEIATDSGGTNIVFTSTSNQLQYTHT